SPPFHCQAKLSPSVEAPVPQAPSLTPLEAAVRAPMQSAAPPLLAPSEAPTEAQTKRPRFLTRTPMEAVVAAALELRMLEALDLQPEAAQLAAAVAVGHY
ncbi:hypothetical protein LCGC14_2018680, partial [marine sediment metagenome]